MSSPIVQHEYFIQYIEASMWLEKGKLGRNLNGEDGKGKRVKERENRGSKGQGGFKKLEGPKE